MATKKPTLGSLTDQMSTLREERRALSKKDDALSAKYKELEEQLLDLLDKEGTTTCRGALAGATIGESTQFEINGDDGWDKFMAYMAKNKLYHLVQRRVAVEATRELFTTKGQVPGLQPYVKRVINLRNL